jgi:two-component system, LytTR family, response regulator LytT
MITALIIEDEEHAALRLKKLLRKLDPEIEILSTLDTIESSVKWFENHPAPDIIMLDIQLGDGNSFEIFRKVKIDSYVIFTTAYDEYALRAFELNSIDYLLKPVDETRLANSLQKFRKFHPTAKSINVEKLLESFTNKKEILKKRFVVSIANKIKVVNTDEVAYFYSKEKNTFLCTTDNHHYPLDFSLDQTEQMLNPELFFHISRQYIVNFSCINKITVFSKSRIKIETNPLAAEEMLISSSRTADFRVWLDK